MAILAVNAGSSTLKFSVHPLQNQGVLDPVLIGNIQGLEPAGQPRMDWTWQGQRHQRALPTVEGTPFERALHALHGLLAELPALPPLRAVAHRVVHGGHQYQHSVRITPEVLRALEQLNSLAPLHQPHNLAGIRAFTAAFPELPQVACFDTAFHATLPREESHYALPQTLADQGVRRYGFHGLSYQSIMGTLQSCSARAHGRTLMAHLGNGASLCATLQGRSQATTMGFSALDGLVMGTRCGSIDPGVLLYLLEQGWDHDRIQALLYRQSGLLGVSGIAADMRTLRASTAPAAQFAIELFTRRVVRATGELSACIGGLDVLAFSGGIGENDSLLRADVAQRLAYLGVRVDATLNARPAHGHAAWAIHAPDSAVEVWVVPTDEGRVAAAEAAALVL
ncbi:acetate/propionate family kinase [Acidovorax sp. 210-6]|jgi:acetate kinase|uniref:acetate/propionate family kinase n=1 Tax=Acidovorax sp. 210-6 TaxID=2699468 RepID=UPI00138A1BCB|nr:acetate/propionate family kinase [Acidovorax sp. 210-6]NCU66410.1 acetate/propionate family kinase [Acidovorax sp. 210-6]